MRLIPAVGREVSAERLNGFMLSPRRLTSAFSGRRARLHREHGWPVASCAPAAADARRWADQRLTRLENREATL